MPNKIKTTSQLKGIVRKLRREEKKVVFTNGCFDILHRGHTEYLKKAKALGDVLVVGLNTDASVRRLKGPFRPLNKQADRAAVLAGLETVDYVVFFDEETPLNLIKVLRPDILVKGGDWKVKDIVGADIVKSSGGKALSVPYIKGYSTTALIKKLREETGEGSASCY